MSPAEVLENEIEGDLVRLSMLREARTELIEKRRALDFDIGVAALKLQKKTERLKALHASLVPHGGGGDL